MANFNDTQHAGWQNVDWSDPNSVANLLEATMNNPDALKAISQHFGIDLSGRYPAFEIAKRMLGPEMGKLALQFAQQYALQPVIGQAVSQGVNSLLNPATRVNEANAAIDAGAASTTTQVINHLKSIGAGIGSIGGASNMVANNAATQKNQNRAYQFSTKGIMDSIGNAIGLVSANAPNLSNLGTLATIGVQTPRSAPGGLGIAGGLVGTALNNVNYSGGKWSYG